MPQTIMKDELSYFNLHPVLGSVKSTACQIGVSPVKSILSGIFTPEKPIPPLLILLSAVFLLPNCCQGRAESPFISAFTAIWEVKYNGIKRIEKGSVFSYAALHYPVLKSEVDVILSIHCGIIHKAVPVILIKFCERVIHLLQVETNLPIFSRFACRSMMALPTSSSRAFTPLLGVTAANIRSMSKDDLLNMDYFLKEDIFDEYLPNAESFYIF